MADESDSSDSLIKEEEQVMSEVHLGCPPGRSGPHISRFTVSIPTGCADMFGGESSKHQILEVDEDGDLVVTRRSKKPKNSSTVTIQHNITSSIPDVGLQVWKAELALSDFLLHLMSTSSFLDGVISIELGAGTGLVGLLLARVAQTVFLTDRGDEILDNCIKNVHLNSQVLNYKASIYVRELDWLKPWPPEVGPRNSGSAERYSWTASEVEEADRSVLLLAADVIYSDDLTDALFSTLKRIMSRGSEKILYLALEKRYNFSLDDRDVVANGYSRFRHYVKNEEECSVHDLVEGFMGKCIDLTEIPQYVSPYDRGKDVEIWQIKYIGETFSQNPPKSVIFPDK